MYEVGAGPVAAGSQATVIVRPERTARRPDGVRGAPEHGPGNDSVMLFDEALLPAELMARSDSV